MKILTYNVNGIRAATSKGLIDWLNKTSYDIICLQETRASLEQINECVKNLTGYHFFWNVGDRKGYSGTGILCKQMPLNVHYNVLNESINEGRIIVLEFENFVVINCYVPNGGMEHRLSYKLDYLNNLATYVSTLIKDKNIIFCSDFNVAHDEIDLSHPKICKNFSGFLPIERKVFDNFLNLGLTDIFRYMHPSKKAYSWVSYQSRRIGGDFGWKYRFDYIIISNSLVARANDVAILDSCEYSDHYPMLLDIDLDFKYDNNCEEFKLI
jgi:exodeoxyribonuclease-3